MDKKRRKSDTFNGDILYWIAPLILALWVILYLYFVSSSQIPSSLFNYDEDLHVREHVLRNTLNRMSKFNPSPTELAQILNLITANEICLNDLPSAEKHLSEAVHVNEIDAKLIDASSLSTLYLQNANLYRDLNKFETAKVSHEASLNSLKQISLTENFNESDLKTAAVNFNNLGILCFLIGQKTIELKEREMVYLKARDYFNQAKQLTSVIGPNKNLCLQQNINENLNRCLLEMQFSN